MTIGQRRDDHLSDKRTAMAMNDTGSDWVWLCVQTSDCSPWKSSSEKVRGNIASVNLSLEVLKLVSPTIFKSGNTSKKNCCCCGNAASNQFWEHLLLLIIQLLMILESYRCWWKSMMILLRQCCLWWCYCWWYTCDCWWWGSSATILQCSLDLYAWLRRTKYYWGLLISFHAIVNNQSFNP